MKRGMIKKWTTLCSGVLLILVVFGINICFAEEWTRVGERCIQNCDDQPTRSNNTRDRTSQGQVKEQKQAKEQKQVTVYRNVDGQKSERQQPVKR
jgi:hypothetical protein